MISTFEEQAMFFFMFWSVAEYIAYAVQSKLYDEGNAAWEF